MTANQLQRALDKAGMSQVGAARDLGISERNMRRYVSGELPIPQVVEMALTGLIRTSTKHVVGVDELKPRELDAFATAMEIPLPAPMLKDTFLYFEPVRDGDGQLCEVRVRDRNRDFKVLAVVPVSGKGTLGKPEINE